MHGSYELGSPRFEMGARRINILDQEPGHGAGIEVTMLIVRWTKHFRLAAVGKLEESEIMLFVFELEAHHIPVERYELSVAIGAGANPCEPFDEVVDKPPPFSQGRGRSASVRPFPSV